MVIIFQYLTCDGLGKSERLHEAKKQIPAKKDQGKALSFN